MSDLIDHSPRHPNPAPPIDTARNLVLIDNYDSFTWNVYQYLVLEGAQVTVYRNDEVTLQDLIAQDPTQLVVSPGPGSKPGAISPNVPRLAAGRPLAAHSWRRNSTVLVLPLVPVTATTVSGCAPA